VRNFVSPLIKLVIFLVITAFATYVLGATIANSSFGSTYSYSANFTDVTGLQIGDDVRIAGVRVGTVKNIKMEQDERHVGFAHVSFTVQKSSRLPESSQVYLRYRNLVGQRYLDIEQGAGDPNRILKPKAEIPISRTHPAVDLTVLFNGFQNLITGLDAPEINKLSYAIIQTLQGEGGALESMLSTIADLTNSLADKDKLIGDVIDNLTTALNTVGQRDTELSALIVQLRDFMSGLAADRHTIGNAINGVNTLAISTASLLSQVRGPFKQDIKSITTLVDTLNKNSGTLTYVIKQLPPTVGALIRTADYGSWFNFYLCSASGIITLPLNKKVQIQIANGSHARCNG
jgi:phospholipid/cholesterol/gamma-HCH transport system substrate-binding protein